MAAKTRTRKPATRRVAEDLDDEVALTRTPCPACGEDHASSLIPAGEIDALGIRNLPELDVYRVYVHVELLDGEATFYAVEP